MADLVQLMDRPTYLKGFDAYKKGEALNSNPYCYRLELVAYCEWAAGYSDALNGHCRHKVYEVNGERNKNNPTERCDLPCHRYKNECRFK